MTPKEKNAYELKLVKLKAEFIKIGIVKMPMDTILGFMPKRLTGVKSIKWANIASNVWNGRSTKYDLYLPIFEKAYEVLKDTEQIQVA